MSCPICGRQQLGVGEAPEEDLASAYEEQEAEQVSGSISAFTLWAIFGTVVGGGAGYLATRYAIGAKSTEARVAGTVVGATVGGAGAFGVAALNFSPGRY